MCANVSLIEMLAIVLLLCLLFIDVASYMCVHAPFST